MFTSEETTSETTKSEPPVIAPPSTQVIPPIKKKAPKEILQFSNMNDLEIKLDPIEMAVDEPPAKTVEMSKSSPSHSEILKKEETKIEDENKEAATTKTTTASSSGAGSLKLKLKVVKSVGDEMVVQVTKPVLESSEPSLPSSSNSSTLLPQSSTKVQVNSSKSVTASKSIDDLIKKSDGEESPTEDDELIRDLKNSYQDNDFGKFIFKLGYF